jgi:1-acyl-sn-glycerol-3-phosphate acyltransferase
VNWFTRFLEMLWGLFAWLFFGLLVLFCFIALLIVPSAGMRQKLATWTARMAFVVPRADVKVRGIDHLPTAECVVVANHASYVDGPLLKGYLPWRFNFVIKGEFRKFPPAHFFLLRSGAKLVERKDIKGSTRDARQLVKAALRGESLGFFPEGTFRKEPGVGRFRPGAFVAARRGDIPVVPVAIHGTRYVLPLGTFLPRRGPMVIDILPTIGPGDAAYEDSNTLAEEARQRILAVLDEPDIAGQEKDDN